jgi:hypothetical protein
MLRLLARLMGPRPVPMLGRWCHPSSEAYARTCDRDRKAWLAALDNGYETLRAPRARSARVAAPSRDPVSVLACE